MTNEQQEVSDLLPETDDVTIKPTQDGMIEISSSANAPSKVRRKPKPKLDMIELDPDNLPAPVAEPPQINKEFAEPNHAEQPYLEPRQPEPLMQQGMAQTTPQQQSYPRLINADFVNKTKAINSVPREVIEQRLDEIDAMFSLRRSTKGTSRDNATIMLAMSLWEIMGL